jgi:mannosyl-3-phosphoglycerate phosphatase
MKTLIIFTDLDGTLLDDTYSFNDALPALSLMKRHNVPLVICSSKTRAEIELYRKRLNNHHPFVSENGGGIFIPRGHFGSKFIIDSNQLTTDSKYDIIRLGTEYVQLLESLKAIREEGFAVKGFGDMSVEEVSQAMGLTNEEAKMAKQRDFDEPFFYSGREEEIGALLNATKKRGLNITRGRIYHLLGQSDKGKAVNILTDLYRRKYGAVVTIGLGDSPNDVPMLGGVDMPIVVQNKDGVYDDSIMSLKPIKARGIGPLGWNNAMLSLLPKLLVEHQFPRPAKKSR